LTAATAAAAVAAFLRKPRRVSTPAWDETEFGCILVSQPECQSLLRRSLG